MITCVDPQGRIFDSENQMCKAHGISPKTYNYRKKQGLPLKICLEPYSNPLSNSRDGGIDFCGRHYRSLRECCKTLGISYRSTYSRVWERGFTAEESIIRSLQVKAEKTKAAAM